MIRFSRYEIRTEPESAPLFVYAPNWNIAQQSRAYQMLLSEYSPRSVQVKEQQYGYYGIAEDREATAEEIEQYRQSPDIEETDSDVFYQYFGNQEVLQPLIARISQEYVGYMKEWETLHEQDLSAFYDKMQEICMVETVYENLVLRSEIYPPEYMEQLLKLEQPLREAVDEYGKQKQFNIREDTEFLLISARMEVMQDEDRHERNPMALTGQSDEERMAVLKEALDQEYRTYEAKWSALDFGDKIDNYLEIFTVRQFYQDLSKNMAEYPPSQVYCLGAFKEPMSYDLKGVLELRVAQFEDEADMSEVFQKLFLETKVEPDQWEVWDIRQRAGFTLKKGRELEYQALEKLNRKNGYSIGIFDYLKRWAGLMEQEMENGLSVEKIAEVTSSCADKDGITGAMYGCAVATLSEYWEHGEQLRVWHNGLYSYEGTGVVNPAVFVVQEDGAELAEAEDNAPQMSM